MPKQADVDRGAGSRRATSRTSAPTSRTSSTSCVGASSPTSCSVHHRHDEHQDHRTVAELVWNTFRNHLIAEYEIPKYEGDLGQPNLFVRLRRSRRRSASSP